MGQLSMLHYETTRFNKENIERWIKKMEYQLKNQYVFYVLTDPQPIYFMNEAFVDERDWTTNDYKYRHLILEILSDSLFS